MLPPGRAGRQLRPGLHNIFWSHCSQTPNTGFANCRLLTALRRAHARAMTIQRHHHITLCVGTAQEDYDFHTKVLSLKSVKKTALYDGDVPVYHLYYGNDLGEESTLVTCFPMRQSGRKARRGTGQTRTLALSIPTSGLAFWADRLTKHGFAITRSERFGEPVIGFHHPCGLDY